MNSDRIKGDEFRQNQRSEGIMKTWPTLIRWLLTKYVPDPGRGEPINVGLILFSGAKVWTRFREDTSFTEDPKNYLDWVDYWRSLAKPEGATPLDFLGGLGRRPSNYYVKHAGKRILGTEETDTETLLNELFERLVKPREFEVVWVVQQNDYAQAAFPTEKKAKAWAEKRKKERNEELRREGKKPHEYPTLRGYFPIREVPWCP